MITYEYKKYNKTRPIQLGMSMYYDKSLAITMTTWEEGYPEPWSVLTVNLGENKKNVAYIDTNNNGTEIIEWLSKNGIGLPTGRHKNSGFCDYPEFTFDEEFLKSIDEYGHYEEYIEQFNESK